MLDQVYRIAAPTSHGMDWGWALPSLVRLLADPDASVGFPRCPIVRTDAGDEFGTALGYWTALDHLLRYQLGWTQPAKGLARWLGRGDQDVCRPLALVKRIWLHDGHLERYLAWRIDKAQEQIVPQLARHLSQITYQYGEPGVPVGPWELLWRNPGCMRLSRWTANRRPSYASLAVTNPVTSQTRSE